MPNDRSSRKLANASTSSGTGSEGSKGGKEANGTVMFTHSKKTCAPVPKLGTTIVVSTLSLL